MEGGMEKGGMRELQFPNLSKKKIQIYVNMMVLISSMR